VAERPVDKRSDTRERGSEAKPDKQPSSARSAVVIAARIADATPPAEAARDTTLVQCRRKGYVTLWQMAAHYSQRRGVTGKTQVSRAVRLTPLIALEMSPKKVQKMSNRRDDSSVDARTDGKSAFEPRALLPTNRSHRC
jgi:hypothetical protein